MAGATGRVKVDPGQIEQVLVNLAVNARDVMPNGGRLVIATANAALDEDAVGRIGDILPGPYVILSVADTGVGMDDETRRLAFEPFFTTKPQGKGTGLGLYMSGYTDEAFGRHGVLEPGTFLLHKPFRVGALGQKVREVLDAPD